MCPEAFAIGLLAAVPAFLLTAGAVDAFEATLAASGDGRPGRMLALTVPFDAVVFGYGLAAGLAAALIVGTMTAVHATRVTPLQALGGLAPASAGTTVTGRRLRTALVAVQVTAAVVLLMGTGVVFERTGRRPTAA